jgi:O-antigen/teichoic acid export membrane protein
VTTLSTSDSSPAGSALRQAGRTLMVRCTVVALSAVTAVVIARTLGPDGRGAYAIVVTLATTALALGHLSVDQAHATRWPAGRGSIMANSALLGPLLGLLTTAAALGFLGTGFVGLPGPGQRDLVVLALFAVPVSMTVMYLSNVLILDGRVGVVDLSALVGNVLQCGALLATAALGWLSVDWVVWIWAVSAAAPLIPLLIAVRPRWHHVDLRLAGRDIWLGARYHGGSAALYLTYRVDVLILASLASTGEVGLYTLAVTLAELIRTPTDAYARASLAAQMGGDLAQAAAVTIRATRISVLLAAGCVTALCLAAPVVIPVTYGPRFSASVPALLALAPGFLALGIGRPVGAYLVRLNRPLTMSSLSVVALVVNVGVNLWAIPRWGIVGCSLSSSVSYTLIAAVHIGRFSRATGTPLRALLPGRHEVFGLTRLLRPAGLRLLRRPVAPLEDVLVAPDPGPAGGQVPQVEAPFVDEPEHLLGLGHLERVPADPVEEVMPARHTPGAGNRSGADRPAPGAQHRPHDPQRPAPA